MEAVTAFNQFSAVVPSSRKIIAGSGGSKRNIFKSNSKKKSVSSLNGNNTIHKRILYTARKIPFPMRNRDYLMEEFNTVSKYNEGRIIVGRSLNNDHIFSTKKSKIRGFTRANLPLKGYVLQALDDDTTNVIFVCAMESDSIFSEFIAKIAMPKALRQVVDTLLEYENFVEHENDIVEGKD